MNNAFWVTRDAISSLVTQKPLFMVTHALFFIYWSWFQLQVTKRLLCIHFFQGFSTHHNYEQNIHAFCPASISYSMVNLKLLEVFHAVFIPWHTLCQFQPPCVSELLITGWGKIGISIRHHSHQTTGLNTYWVFVELGHVNALTTYEYTFTYFCRVIGRKKR